MTVWRFFRTLAGIEAGRWCRVFREPIAPKDSFGHGEGVCDPCRR